MRCTGSRTSRRMLLIGVLLIGAIGAVGGQALATDPEEYEKLLTEKAPAVVTIKCVLKLGGFMGEQEQEIEIPGVMIDSSGLVLCSNNLLVGFTSLMGAISGSAHSTRSACESCAEKSGTSNAVVAS